MNIKLKAAQEAAFLKKYIIYKKFLKYILFKFS